MGTNRSHYRLTRALQPREREALRLAGECLSCKAIAACMRVSPGTVKVYLSHAYESLGFDTLPEYSPRLLAVRWAMSRQLSLPRSSAAHPRTRLLEELCLPPDPPPRAACLDAAASHQEWPHW